MYSFLQVVYLQIRFGSKEFHKYIYLNTFIYFSIPRICNSCFCVFCASLLQKKLYSVYSYLMKILFFIHAYLFMISFYSNSHPLIVILCSKRSRSIIYYAISYRMFYIAFHVGTLTRCCMCESFFQIF